MNTTLYSARSLNCLTPRWRPVHWRSKALRQEVEEVEVETSQSTVTRSRRLWSNLNPETMKHEPGSVFGAAALVAGTTVGAGILALPAVTQVDSSVLLDLTHFTGLWICRIQCCIVWCLAVFCGDWITHC